MLQIYGIIVDVMPDDVGILGFTNRWYKDGMKHKIEKELPNGTVIHVFTTEYYIATKIEAVLNRGGSDLRVSHDFEDMVFVLNNCSEFPTLVFQNKSDVLKEYLKNKFQYFIDDQNIDEIIECALPYGEEDRVEIIYGMMQEVVAL